MNFYQDKSFDELIVLPPLPQTIQPSDCNLEGLRQLADDEWSELIANGNNEEPLSYTELTNVIPRMDFDTYDSELDQFLIFDFDESLAMTTFDNLPEQTLMCTDSCSQFLKESSEILRENSLKFQQHDLNRDGDDGGRPVVEVEEAEKVTFKCTIDGCSKTYSKPAHLRAHLRRHLGLKPYLCNFSNCSWRFSRSDELARHQRSHSGIKPYSCFYCSKTFSRSDHLKKHIKIHEKKLKDGKLKFRWDEIPKQKPGRKKKVHIEA